MGEVYRAKDSRLNRTVAIKVLSSEKTADSERKRRFMQEARAASALNHSNIITIYDINADNGVDFIAMEYLSGKTLDQIIPRKALACPAEGSTRLQASGSDGLLVSLSPRTGNGSCTPSLIC
jgi:serine/threonine protein kinase